MHRPHRGSVVQVFSPAGFEVNRIDLPVAGLPGALDGLRIVHLSDTHLTGRWFGAYDRLITLLRDDPADLVCFTGDLVDQRWDPSRALGTAERFARSIAGRIGTFAVLGNHDGDLMARHLRTWGWTLLHPGSACVQIDEAALEIIGLPCVARLDLTPRVIRRLPPKRPGIPRIVLSHYPDHVRRIGGLDPDVLLTGHTHGGQCCLPGGMPIITHDSLPRSMCKGVFRVGRSWLVISRGLGFATYRIRIFCPGEVAEIVLRAA
jgi:predicted MPP superfamily phosphohydrolase